MGRNMKDSGIEWCGMIPEHWNVMPNKYVMYKKKELCPKYEGQNILSLTMDGVIVRDLDAGGKMPATFDGYQIVYPNNLLMCLFDYDVTPRCIGLIKNEGLTSPAYSQFVMKDENSSRYYYYYYLMIDNTKELLHLAKNLRHSFTEEQLGAINTPVPPVEEQERIADYLDEKIREIVSIISKTKESIKEYKKYKQSVIADTVTKGISSSCTMKDSGIEWIGEIADTHPLKKLKYVCQILDQYRKPVTADQRSQNGDVLYDYYGASGVIDKIDDYTIDDHVMLIGEDGANLRMRNLPLMYEVNGKAWINNHAHILKPTEDTYFYYLFYALEGLDINPYITGSAQPKLSQDNLKNIWIPMPAYDEQKEIADYLDKKCAEIDALIAKKEAFVEEMEAYKKSLIYEYVTGKKEVL